MNIKMAQTSADDRYMLHMSVWTTCAPLLPISNRWVGWVGEGGKNMVASGDDVELMPVQLVPHSCLKFLVSLTCSFLLVLFFFLHCQLSQWTIRDISTRVIEALVLWKHPNSFAASPSTVAATSQVVVPMETTSTFFHNSTKHGPTRVIILSFDWQCIA